LIDCNLAKQIKTLVWKKMSTVRVEAQPNGQGVSHVIAVNTEKHPFKFVATVPPPKPPPKPNFKLVQYKNKPLPALPATVQTPVYYSEPVAKPKATPVYSTKPIQKPLTLQEQLLTKPKLRPVDKTPSAQPTSIYAQIRAKPQLRPINTTIPIQQKTRPATAEELKPIETPRARVEVLLKILVENKQSLNGLYLLQVAKKTEGMSTMDLKLLVSKAVENAKSRNSPKIDKQDMDAALLQQMKATTKTAGGAFSAFAFHHFCVVISHKF
jgi:hypothetical protein